MKKALAISLVLIALGASLAAQARLHFTIQCSESGAQVFLNDKPVGKTAPTLNMMLVPGTYKIKIVKAGFKDFEISYKLSPPSGVVKVDLIPLGPPAVVPPPPRVQQTITVNANAPNAEVFINGANVGRAPVTFAVPTNGTYSVLVRAPGYNEYSTSVTVTGPVKVNALLTPQIINYSITVNSNVQGAEVLINGNRAGVTPFSAQVPAGSYTVLVRAPGYFDFTQNVAVNGPVQVNATLQGLNYQLTVDANLRGADVFVNGNQVGKTPFVGMLPPGGYSVVVRAPGYNDYVASVTLNGPQTVMAALQPAAAGWQILLSEAYTNKDLKGGHWSHIQVYVDGQLQKSPSGQVVAGRHVIRLVSGGLAVETIVEFQAGRTYSFEPTLGLTVK